MFSGLRTGGAGDKMAFVCLIRTTFQVHGQVHGQVRGSRLYVVRRKRDVEILAFHGDRIRRDGQTTGDIDAGTILQAKTPTVPQTGDGSIVQRPIVQWGASVRTHVFQSIKSPMFPENDDKEVADTKFTSGLFRDVVHTGETDRA